MGTHFSHVIFVCICAVGGVLSYSTFLILICRGCAVGNRKDASCVELSHRVASYHQAVSRQTGRPLSDCPALSEILAVVASTGIVKPGIELVVTNSPHSPLVLAVTEASNANCDSTELMADTYRLDRTRFFLATSRPSAVL